MIFTMSFFLGVVLLGRLVRAGVVTWLGPGALLAAEAATAAPHPSAPARRPHRR